MIFFVDIDGCIVDNYEAYFKCTEKYLQNRRIPYNKPDRSFYRFNQVFGTETLNEQDIYESEEFAPYFVARPKEGVQKVLQKMKLAGDGYIVLLTHRNEDLSVPVTKEVLSVIGHEFSNRSSMSLRRVTELYMKAWGIPYDDIVFTKELKANFVSSFGGRCLAIEDSPSQLKGYSKLEIPCIKFEYPYNKDSYGFPAKEWNDILTTGHIAF